MTQARSRDEVIRQDRAGWWTAWLNLIGQFAIVAANLQGPAPA
jgi:hypothetical protein